MDDGAAKLLQQAETIQQRFEADLNAQGLSLTSLRALADAIRRRLPEPQLRRIEEAKAALLPVRRQRPGSSRLVIPLGIRG